MPTETDDLAWAQMKRDEERTKGRSEEDSFWGEPISVYTDEDAVEDGVLMRVSDLVQLKPTCPVNLITTRLLYEYGYINNDDKVNKPCIIDLIAQAVKVIVMSSKPDWFYHKLIELPSGEHAQIFIEQNSTGKYTILMPSEH